MPGELDPSALKDKDLREQLVDVRHEVYKLVMTDQMSQVCTKPATLFSIGADSEYRKPTAQAEMKFNGDAMRELAAAAVLEYMKDADKKPGPTAAAETIRPTRVWNSLGAQNTSSARLS